jgi:outer membrane receptor protein involved in Fe transport
MDGAVRFNGTLFYLDWEDYQMELVDPSFGYDNCPGSDEPIPNVCGQPWQVSIGNAGDAHILGVNMELDWAISHNWVFGINGEWLEAENDTDLHKLGVDVNDGDDLPTVADWTGAAWLNYEQPMDYFGGSSFFARLQWSYRGDSVNTLENEPADGSSANPQLENPESDVGDFRMGVRGDSWEVSAFVNNLTDERAIYTIESGAFEYGAASSIDGRSHTQKSYVNRPREYGIRITKHWGG